MADPQAEGMRRSRPLLRALDPESDPVVRAVARTLLLHPGRTKEELATSCKVAVPEIERALAHLGDRVVGTFRLRERTGRGVTIGISLDFRPRLLADVRVRPLGDGAWVEAPGGRGFQVDATWLLVLRLLDGRTVDEISAACMEAGRLVLPFHVAPFLAMLEDIGALENFSRALPVPDRRARWTRLLELDLATWALPRHALPTVLGRLVRVWLSPWGTAVLTCLTMGIAVAYLAGFGAWASDTARLYAVGVVSLFVHETGHVVALSAFGARARRITLRLTALVVPMLVVDVTEAWGLPRADRIRVLAAGVAANALLACLAAPLAWSGSAVAHEIVAVNLLAIAANLTPALRTDGYQILAQLLGVNHLQARALEVVFGRRGARPPDRRFRVIAWAYVLTSAASVLGALILLIRFLAGVAS